MNERLQRIAAGTYTNQEDSKPDSVRLIIGDSNCQLLIPDLLHEEKNVRIEYRYTLEEAIREIPDIQRDVVTDVVMLTGINTLKSVQATIPGTVNRFDEMCQLYANHFFNAVIHVGSVAPSCQKFIL